MKYCLLLLLITSAAYAQPRNMKEAIEYLDRECSDSLKMVIRESKPANLRNERITSWINNPHSKIYRYLRHQGVHSQQRIIIITAYKEHLLGKPLDEKALYALQIEREKRLKAANKKKLFGGVYIPKDLADAIAQIDKMWDDSTKQEIRQMTENEFAGRTHRGFGMWIRNNWGLWKGSRLSRYFNDMGIFHPDDISGIILTCYYRHLKDEDFKVDELVKHYQDYWKQQQKSN